MSVYLENFNSAEDIERSFGCKLPEGAEILLAWYGYGSYCGSSFVLYRHDGKLYENHASHCSCYGLEGQWEPEETTVAALKMRDLYSFHHDSSYYGYCDGQAEAAKSFREIVDSLEADGKA